IDVRGWVTDEELRRLYRNAKGLLLAAREDFGMTAVEAQACGCPIIAFSAGGASDIVQDGINGILFAEQHVDDIVRAVHRFEAMEWPEKQVRCQVETFSREAFQTKVHKFIADRIESKVKPGTTELELA